MPWNNQPTYHHPVDASSLPVTPLLTHSLLLNQRLLSHNGFFTLVPLIMLPPLQEIGFLVTVANRHQIVYIRDQNLLSRSYETVTERHSMRRS